ncbi:hypothetical protein CVT25_015056 [Psilocybe cyanescens]|uniref:SET domain-containing protein n=1 Tax=Psilocybe cyanescens TaxID=93625 RepID=A0A409WRZ1_PSICY|nr:hypothetical protein CVT25_015056 [Psilocybe cyanescens]
MPSVQRRGGGKNGGKAKNLKSQNSKNSTSSKGHWKLFVFGLLAALASIVYYRQTSILTSLKVRKAGNGVDIQDGPIFNVVDIPGKGKGVLAARDIKQGELVLREKSLFTVPLHVQSSPAVLIAERLQNLSPVKKEAFFNLSYVHFPEDLDPTEHVDRLALAIFETNAVSAGKDTVGIFPNMARLNHGCSSAFNVVYSWRNEQEGLFVHALKDVKKGQELLTTYTDTKRPRQERRAYLTQQYGFHCTCDVCSLPDGLSKASDRRLSEISSLYRKFATWGSKDIDGIEAINYIRKIWGIEDEEGYWSERGQLAADAAWVAASHSDVSATRAWALKAAKWFTYEIGADTPQVQTLIMAGDRPQSHNAWGTRDKLEVSGP